METKNKRGGLKTYQAFTPPSPYEMERRKAEQQRRYAELLQEQAMAEDEPYTYQGIRAMPSPAAALGKLLKAYGAKKASEKADEAEARKAGMEQQASQQIMGRLFGGAPMSQADTTPDESGLAEVAVQSQYRQDPTDAMRLAATPQGVGAMKGNPMLAAMLQRSIETPKEAEYGTTPQYDDQGRAYVVNKAGNVRYLKDVKAPAAAPAAVTPATIMRDGRKVVVDARTGAEIGLAPIDAPATSGPKESAEGLRKEFTNQTSQYRGVSDAFQKIKSAALNPSAANDLSLIFGYMRALDPASTVREGEFANAQNAGGIDATIRNVYNKVASGERLTQAQRQDFLQSAYGLVESQIPNVQQTIDRYTSIAGRAGLNPEDIVSDPFASVRIPRLQGDNDPMFAKLKSGDLFIAPNGRIMRKR
jgi:hypothetical protein